MHRFAARSLALVALASLVLVVGSPAARASHPDSWITTKVKMALLTSKDVSGFAVNVDTTDGRVTLHGKVPSDLEQRRAEEVARQVQGVRDVRNLLVVVPAEQREQVSRTDDEIEPRVQAALSNEKSLADSSIRVASVNDGVVLLGGDAASLSDHLRALETARAVEGVRRVESQIESPDELADREIYRESERETEEARAEAGSAARDLRITAETKLRLLVEEDTPGLAINVDTRNGQVTLFGSVPDDKAKQVAENIALQVGGVRGVENELQIVPEAEQGAVERKDDELHAAVEGRLAKRADLADADIDVEVSAGVVRLTGEVSGLTDRLTALTTARTTDGVRSVVDDLRIKPRTDVAAPPPGEQE